MKTKGTEFLCSMLLVAIVAVLSAGIRPYISNRQHCPDIIVPDSSISASDTLDSWQILQMALVMTESEFNTAAMSPHGAVGILQITPIYVAESNRIAGTSYTMDDAPDVVSSLEMFRIVQGWHNPEKDIDRAIKLHNPTAGEWYSRRVKANMQKIQAAEKIRQSIIKQSL